ncbi:MAG TPA: transporter [Candidatus Polarisedimenticolaceae bacterium]|nr:transporter [Candidatus Polarisedimenticolaceae bacterium]
MRSAAALALLLLAPAVQAQTPVAGHYPPGQSGIRGGASPAPGWNFINFNRAFSNLEVKDGDGETTAKRSETRYANITMIMWTSERKVLGMDYGWAMGIPFATGDLQASGDQDASFGLGDVLFTPLCLYARRPAWDYQFQFTVWTPSGHFEPGSSSNRGTGYWALVYSAGAAWYPGEERKRWSLSAIARIEQNFEQKDTGITPGDDLVIDWGVGRVLGERWDVGVSGFATWQLSEQQRGDPALDTTPYRYYGAGPEGSLTLSPRLALRLRAQWEFGVRNAVAGNNLWFIASWRGDRHP